MRKSLFHIRTTFFQQQFYLLLLAVFVFCLVGLGLILPLQPAGYPLADWQVETNGIQTHWTLPAFQAIEPGLTELTLRTTFPKVDADTLVLPHISGNAVIVTLNQKAIYQLGDFSNPTANLWNSVLIIHLPQPLQAQNTIEIRLASAYFANGLNAVPGLVNLSADATQILWLGWIYNDFLLMATGMALIIGLILILLGFLRRKFWTTEFYTGLSLLFSVVFYQDMLFRTTSGDISSFLWFKKLILISGYLALLFFVLGMEKYLAASHKIINWLIALTALATLTTLLAPDLFSLSTISQFTSIITALNIIAVVVLILSQPQKPAWLLFPAALFILSILQMVVIIPFKISWPLEVPYIMAITTLSFGVNLVLEFNQIYNENLQLQYTNSIDPLTGAMNRRVLKNLNTALYNFVVLIDLDRFKQLNDTYGHPFGDAVLIEFSRIARNCLRQRDQIIRWGGDEFLLVLSDVPKTINGFHQAESIIHRIGSQYARFHADLNLTFSFGITMVENSFEKSLEEADIRMYHMKQAHKSGNSNSAQ